MKKVLVYVLNMRGQPLMPCSPRKARVLLKQGKAKVIRRSPFTIQLLIATGENKQPITLGVDPGYSNIGLSAITNKKELFSTEVTLRKNLVKLNSDRRMYRQLKRGRLWYRQCRFLNRVKSKKKGWLAPSVRHRLESHIRIVNFIKSMLPINRIIIEANNFDIQKIKNPDIQGKEYQKGVMKDFYNVREYVLHRDNHQCRSCRKKNTKLEVHHIESRKTGSNRPENLVTLCNICHEKITLGKEIKYLRPKSFKAATFMSIIRWKLVESLKANVTYGYLTKLKRRELNLPKSHTNDAFVIANGISQSRTNPYSVFQNRRNNRCLQKNRKGYKPSIRKQRYNLRPKDLVRFGTRVLKVVSVHSYGKYIRLKSKINKVIDKKILNIELLKYSRGFEYVNER